MAERVIIVSSDSHAGMPKELWEDYLPQEFHDLLPRLRHDNVIYPTAMKLQTLKLGVMSHPEHAEVHETGWHGLFDPVLRMADMDREGITAELVFLGDNRLGDLFHNVMNDVYPFDAWQAGAQAWNRWASDAHGFATERFLLTGAIGPGVDMDATVGELQWIADHDFTGTYAPGYVHHSGNPPLSDEYWEPFWSVCEDTGLAVVVHAGFGTERGEVYPQVKRMYDDCVQAAGTTDAEALFAHADAISDESLEYFFNFFTYNVEARRPLWQLMLGGVFDRHPELRFIATEIRLDWVPATLRLLDRVYEEHRDALPAQRRPSEYWHTNCLGGASFVHKAEIEMRDEIGIETMSFGRDFPHPEGSWPHTREWLLDAFAGLPENDARAILGENAIRFLGLDRDRLAAIAKRIGPTIEDVVGGGEVAPDLLANFDLRGGYLKPAEGEAKLPLVEDAVRTDLARLGVG